MFYKCAFFLEKIIYLSGLVFWAGHENMFFFLVFKWNVKIHQNKLSEYVEFIVNMDIIFDTNEK